MERDVNPVVAEAQHPRGSTGRAGLKDESILVSGEPGSPSQAVLPLHKAPARFILHRVQLSLSHNAVTRHEPNASSSFRKSSIGFTW